MAMVANNPAAAKRVGIKQSVGEDFMKADKGKKFDDGGEVAPDGNEFEDNSDEPIRKSFATGVTVSKDYGAPEKKASKPKPKIKDSAETKIVSDRYLTRASSGKPPKRTLREQMESGSLSGRRMFSAGGNVRGSGCESRGKTKGRFI